MLNKQLPGALVLNKMLLNEMLINKKVPSRGVAETMLERSDDSPKGEVCFLEIKKPRKSTGVTL